MDIFSECKALYNSVFGEADSTFEDRLFEECFNYCRYLERDGKVVSLLFLLPCKTGKENCFYLFAAATKMSERKKGYMSKLINDILKETDTPIFLRPANDALINYYGKLGFNLTRGTKQKNEPCIVPQAEFEALIKSFDFKETNETYPLMYSNNKKIDFRNINFVYTME